MLRLALKNLWAYKRRLLTSALSVVLGISFLSGSFVFTDTLKGLFSDLFASATEGVDATVRATRATETTMEDQNPYGDGRATLRSDLIDTIRKVPDVAAAAGSVDGYAQLINKKGKLERVGQAPTFGYLWVDDTTLSPYRLRAGSAPRAANEVVIDAALAKSTGYDVGDSAKVNTLEGANTYKIVGVATFGSSDSALGATAVFFEPKAGEELLLKAGTVQSYLVRAKPGVSQASLVAALQSALQGAAATNGQPLEAVSGAALERENIAIFNQFFDFLNIFFTAFAVVALFVSIFVISNSFSIVVAQRAREMAMLRILGAKRSQILGSTFGEALIVGVLASAVGVAFGLVIAFGITMLLNATGFSLPTSGLVMKPRTIVLGMVVGTLVTIVSSIAPAIRSSRVRPLAALRDLAVDRGAGSRVRLVFGAIVTALSIALLVVGLGGKGGDGALRVGISAGLSLVAVTLLGPIIAKPVASVFGRQWFGWIVALFGVLVTLGGLYTAASGFLNGPILVPVGLIAGFIGVYLVRTGLAARMTAGHIARQNAIRNPTRTSATALALTIGTALVSALLVLSQSLTGTFRGALDATVKADYVVASASDIGFPEEAREILDRVPGVVATSGLRFARVRFGFPARQRTLGAVDPADFAQLVDLGKIEGDFTKLGEPNTIAIAEKSAESNSYKLGDTISPQFPNGDRPTLTIVAVYEKPEGLGEVYYLTSVPTLKEHDESEADNYLYVKSDGKNNAAFEKAAEAALAGYPAAELKSKKKFADQQVGQINQFLVVVNALLLLAIIIAILGIANTLKLSLFERTREIGLLRAVGMSREQVKSAIRWEAIVVATLGSVIGVVLGTGFGSALVYVLGKDGSVKLTVPVLFLVVITLLASIVGLYAARKPAKDAAKLNILRAIATE